MTPTHYDVLLILAKAQLEESMGEGMPYSAWYDRCVSTMLVANDMAFMACINEMTDHHVVEETSIKVYKIPFDEDIISQEIIDRDV